MRPFLFPETHLRAGLRGHLCGEKVMSPYICYKYSLLLSHETFSFQTTRSPFSWEGFAIDLLGQSINQSMFISQATTQRIFQARKAFEQGHCLQVISQAKATGCMMAHGCFSTRSAEPGNNLIWRERTEGADNTWGRPCQGGVDSGRMRGRWR